MALPWMVVGVGLPFEPLNRRIPKVTIRTRAAMSFMLTLGD